ncbi:MAG: hypothetical protein ACUVTH_12625, partial [Thermogutta sp.]
MRYGRVIGLLTGLLAFCWALEASAGWMPAFSGYSAFSDDEVVDGYVSFAVWQAPFDDTWSGVSAHVWTGGRFEERPLTGGYVYLYQVVNVQFHGDSLTSFRIYDDPGAFLQMGYLMKNSNNVVFFDEADGEGKVGNFTNPALG